MRFLSTSEVIELHKMLIAQFGGLYGIRDKGLLESALSYPQLLYSIGMERDINLLAACYCMHLIKNHPFVDGNKRIGVLAMITFIKANGKTFSITQNQLYELAIKVAISEIDENGIARILKIKHY